MRCSLLGLAKDCLKGVADRVYRQMQTQRETVRKKYEEQNSTEDRSEVCNLCSVVTETFGVLSLFVVTQCYSYSKIKSVIINCNFTWRIPNKSSIKSRTYTLFVVLPGKHAIEFCMLSCWTLEQERDLGGNVAAKNPYYHKAEGGGFGPRELMGGYHVMKQENRKVMP
jgi:hypothetical protein